MSVRLFYWRVLFGPDLSWGAGWDRDEEMCDEPLCHISIEGPRQLSLDCGLQRWDFCSVHWAPRRKASSGRDGGDYPIPLRAPALHHNPLFLGWSMSNLRNPFWVFPTPLSPCTATLSHHQPEGQREGTCPPQGGTRVPQHCLQGWWQPVSFLLPHPHQQFQGSIRVAGRGHVGGVRGWRGVFAKCLARWFLAACLARKGSFLPGIVLLPNLGHVLFGIQIRSRNHPVLWYFFCVIRSVWGGQLFPSPPPRFLLGGVVANRLDTRNQSQNRCREGRRKKTAPKSRE